MFGRYCKGIVPPLGREDGILLGARRHLRPCRLGDAPSHRGSLARNMLASGSRDNLGIEPGALSLDTVDGQLQLCGICVQLSLDLFPQVLVHDVPLAGLLGELVLFPLWDIALDEFEP